MKSVERFEINTVHCERSEAISIFNTEHGIASVVPCLPAGRLPCNDVLFIFEMASDSKY